MATNADASSAAAAVTPVNADVHNMFLRGVPPAAAASAAASFDDSSPDSKYAYSAVGHALVMALSEAAARRPDDPVEFVAQRLLNYGATVAHCQERDAEVEAYRQMRTRQLEEEARQRAIQEELRQQQELAERRLREELDRLRQTVPLEALALPQVRERRAAKSGATQLHTAVREGCDAEALLRLLHAGHSFCTRDAQGLNVRDAAAACKNDAVVKEIDGLVVRWIREEKLGHLRWLLAADYGGSFPSLKKAFGPKLKGLPEASRKIIDAMPQWEARYRELWKLSAKGTREHLEAHCRQLKEQQHPEDVYSRNREGHSAMHVALLCKNLEAVRYLATEYPGLLNMADNLGRLPIHYAHGAGQNFVELVRQQQPQQSSSEPTLDALGFAPAVYAKRYDLLPEPPNYGSPELLVTVEGGDADDEAGAAAAADGAASDAAATADGGADSAASGEAGESAGGGREEADQSKLTPINEDEGED